MGAPKGWIVQRYNAREAGPDYTCPRCHRPVSRMSEHVVAWETEEGLSRGGDPHTPRHRHWHSACWTAAVREGIDRYRWG